MFSTTITSEMVNEFIAKALNASIDLGGRILAALIIFIIGKILVNWANKLFAKMLEKRKVEPSIQSFLKSIVNITLLVLLFLAVFFSNRLEHSFHLMKFPFLNNKAYF